MAATGLDVFDKTLQTTHTWLDEIGVEIGPDRQLAWHALGAVLHALRDRLPIEMAAHLGAQLPLLVRGLYYDQWHPAGQPQRLRTLDEFLQRIAHGLQGTRPLGPQDAARAVFLVLARHITGGQIRKVIDAMPAELRTLWPADAGIAGAPGR